MIKLPVPYREGGQFLVTLKYANIFWLCVRWIFGALIFKIKKISRNFHGKFKVIVKNGTHQLPKIKMPENAKPNLSYTDLVLRFILHYLLKLLVISPPPVLKQPLYIRHLVGIDLLGSKFI